MKPPTGPSTTSASRAISATASTAIANACARWADDINDDGWPDQIVVGFPGAPAYWYENPKGASGYWPQHEIWHSACNETPLYTDLFGDGQARLVDGFST